MKEEGVEEDKRIPEYLRWMKEAPREKRKAEEGKSLSELHNSPWGKQGSCLPSNPGRDKSVPSHQAKASSSGPWWVRYGFALE